MIRQRKTGSMEVGTRSGTQKQDKSNRGRISGDRNRIDLDRISGDRKMIRESIT